MIYCNIQDVDFEFADEDGLPSGFRCSRFYNSDGDDVTEILPADPITIRPLLPNGNPILLIVDTVEAGLIYPLMPKIKVNLDDLPNNVGVYRGE